MWQILRDAASLDVVDQVPMFSRPELVEEDRLEPEPGWEGWKYRSRFLRCLMFFRQMTMAWKQCELPQRTAQGDALFVAWTTNQTRAIDPVFDAYEAKGNASQFLRLNGDPMKFYAHLWAIPYFPCVLLVMLRSRDFAWTSFRWALEKYWLAYGQYIVARRWLRRSPPNVLVLSNDHSEWPRALMAAAQAEGIPTVYMQHAPVTSSFPRLSMDYALLEGRHALDTYANKGSSATEVFLIGMPRLDSFAEKINRGEQAQNIGFCVGKYDSQTKTESLLRFLVNQCPHLHFCIRLHPGVDQSVVDYWSQICEELRLENSDSRTEHPFDFLCKLDVVIAGNSGILLEAAIINVTPLTFKFLDNFPDLYDFEANGLSPVLAEEQKLADWLHQLTKHRPSVRESSKYYCATVDTAKSGQSSKQTAELIGQIAAGEGIAMNPWKAIADIKELVSYEPV